MLRDEAPLQFPAFTCPAVPCSSVTVREGRSASGLLPWTDESKFSCLFVCFLPWRTLACLLSFCLPARARLHQRGRAINPALRRLPSDDTRNNSSLSAVRDESHPPLVSSPKYTLSLGEAPNLFLLLREGREHLKFLKGQAVPRPYTSGDVSNSFYGSQLGQEWEFYISAAQGRIISRDGVCVCVRVRLASHSPDDAFCAAFVKYDSGAASPAADLVSSRAYLALSILICLPFVSLTESIFNSTCCS